MSVIKEYAQKGTRGKSKETIRTYSYALAQFENWLKEAGTDLNGYGRMDVQQYIDYLSFNKKSAATINKVFNAIKSFSKWAKKEETVEEIRLVKAPNFRLIAPKSLQRLDRLRIVREADRKDKKRDYAIVMVLLNTGVRVSELVALNKDDITIGDRKGSIIVRQGKGNKERTIPLNPETRRAITNSLMERKDDNPALFISNRIQRISKRTVQHMLQKYEIHPHMLRHTFITELIRNGKKDLPLVQFLSGHNSMEVLSRYSGPTEDDMQKAIDELFIDKI